jgi:hypothetical protein
MTGSRVPDRFPPAVTFVVPARVERAARRAEIAVAEHGLQAWAEAEIDRIDTEALESVVTTQTLSEIELYERFAQRAGTSAVKQQILATKLAAMSRANDRRLARHFG